MKVLKTLISRSNESTPERYEFGPFQLDCQTRELWRGDEVVALTPKAFDLLQVLVTSRDQVVEKNELMQRVWPDSFVSEDSLTQNIATLRRALGDSSDRPQYIVTVPRHGYRFVASVKAVSDPTRNSSVSQEPDAAQPAPSQGATREATDESNSVRSEADHTSQFPWVRRGLIISTTVLVVATGLAIASFRRAPASPQAVMRFVVTAPDGTTFSPSASFLTVSPNGRLLAFLAHRPGAETRIWVRSLDSLVARELAGTDGALDPFWAADSHHLGFFAHDQLKTVSLFGEPPKTLCDLLPGHTHLGASWSSDDLILFSNANAIWRISSTGGVPTPVTVVDSRRGETAHLLPEFLPDGRHFTYLARGATRGPIDSWIVVGSLDGSQPRRLIHASSQALYADPGYLLFLDNGALFAQPFDFTRFQLTGAPLQVSDADEIGFNPATPRGMFAVSQTGLLAYRTSTVRELGWFDRSGRLLGRIGAAGRDSNPAISPDGRRVAVSRYDRSTSTRNLWIIDLEHTGMASQFTSHQSWATCPLWSPDGTRIVFASGATSGAGQLYEKILTGTADERALVQLTYGCPLDWSRDGQSLLYGISGDSGSSGSGLWILPLVGKAAPKSLAGPWPRVVWAHISPNGRWMAYVSDTSGRNEVYVRSFPAGDVGPWRVSSHGGIDPRWRGDGRELFFIGADQELMAVPVVTEGDFRASTPTALFLTGLDPAGLGISGHNQYIAAADGTRFLLNQPRLDASPPPVTVVLNWPAGLKK